MGYIKDSGNVSSFDDDKSSFGGQTETKLTVNDIQCLIIDVNQNITWNAGATSSYIIYQGTASAANKRFSCETTGAVVINSKAGQSVTIKQNDVNKYVIDSASNHLIYVGGATLGNVGGWCVFTPSTGALGNLYVDNVTSRVDIRSGINQNIDLYPGAGTGGNLTINGTTQGIVFPNVGNAALAQTSLNIYRGAANATAITFGALGAQTLIFTRIGNMVFMQFPQITNAATGAPASFPGTVNTIDALYRPDQTVELAFAYQDVTAGFSKTAMVSITSAGVPTLLPNAAAWAASIIINRSSVCYFSKSA
jgi:hypothetical protein